MLLLALACSVEPHEFAPASEGDEGDTAGEADGESGGTDSGDDESGTDDTGGDSQPGDTGDTGDGCTPAPIAPEVNVVTGQLDGFLVVPWYDPGAGTSGVFLLDPSGCPTWATDAPPFATAAHFVGDDVWFNEQGPGQGLHRRSLVGGAGLDLPAAGAHHDFVVHEDGTLAWLAEEHRVVDGVEVVGDQLVERRPDGTEVVVWSAFDTLTIEEHEGWGTSPYDWTHANGLDWDPVQQRYLVSIYWTAQVIEVDRATGAITASIDGDLQPDPFGPQHSPTFLDDGVRLFDNGAESTTSRVLELSWDGTVRRAWTAADELWTPVLGDVLPRADGSLVVAFGATGVVLAVEPDGSERWRIDVPGLIVGQVDWRGP